MHNFWSIILCILINKIIFVNTYATIPIYNISKSEESKRAFYKTVDQESITQLHNVKGTFTMKNLSNQNSQTLYHYNIELVTLSDIREFVSIATTVGGTLKLTSGDDFSVNAKSFLGVMLAKKLNWENLTLIADHECYHDFKQFIV